MTEMESPSHLTGYDFPHCSNLQRFYASFVAFRPFDPLRTFFYEVTICKFQLDFHFLGILYKHFSC